MFSIMFSTFYKHISRICHCTRRPYKNMQHTHDPYSKRVSFNPVSFSAGFQGADCSPCSNDPPHQFFVVCELHPCWNCHHAGARLLWLPSWGKCIHSVFVVVHKEFVFWWPSGQQTSQVTYSDITSWSCSCHPSLLKKWSPELIFRFLNKLNSAFGM